MSTTTTATADTVAVADPARLAAMLKGTDEVVAPKTLDAMTLDEVIEHRAKHLTAYQNGRLARRYRKLVDQVRDAAKQGGYGDALPRAAGQVGAALLDHRVVTERHLGDELVGTGETSSRDDERPR